MTMNRLIIVVACIGAIDFFPQVADAQATGSFTSVTELPTW